MAYCSHSRRPAITLILLIRESFLRAANLYSNIKTLTYPSTFFQGVNKLPIVDGADPLRAWSFKEIIDLPYTAKHDLYGRLYKYLQKLLVTFCERLRDLKTNFYVDYCETADLSERIKDYGFETGSFDRIEVGLTWCLSIESLTDHGSQVGNLCESDDLKTEKCLKLFGPFLRPASDNPSATLIGVYIDAVNLVDDPTRADYSARRDWRVQQYLAIPPGYFPARSRTFTAEILRFTAAKKLFKDVDALFKVYMKRYNTQNASYKAGLVVKEKNTIVEKWPLQLKKGASQKEFDVLMSIGHTGCERYVEWKRVESNP